MNHTVSHRKLKVDKSVPLTDVDHVIIGELPSSKFDTVQKLSIEPARSIEKNEKSDLTQSEIDDAIISFWTTKGISLIKSTTTKEEFLFTDGHGSIYINTIVHGDINGDGFKDVMVATTWCSASCGNPIMVIINQKGTYDGNNFPQKYSIFKGDFPGIEDGGYARPEIIDIHIVRQLVQIEIKDKSGMKDYYYRLSSTNGSARYIFTKCDSVLDETGECVVLN